MAAVKDEEQVMDTIAQDEKDGENSEEVQSLYGKLNAKTWEYGWFCDLKEYL